jgi:hypothetical protein
MQVNQVALLQGRALHRVVRVAMMSSMPSLK